MQDKTEMLTTGADEIDDRDLLTDHEKERLRHDRIAARNARLDDRRRALKNRRRGLPEPKVGDFLHVTIARGITQRNRGGVTFQKNVSTKVEVVDAEDEELARLQKTHAVVSVAGAELILEDDALISRSSPAGDEDLATARQTIVSHEVEIARLKQELALRDAKRAARKSVDADNDAAPARLNAAKAATEKFNKGQAAGNATAPGGFSGAGAPSPASGTEMTDFITPDKD